MGDNKIESIFVTYDNRGLPPGYKHMALHYIDRTGVHRVVEAFPRNNKDWIEALLIAGEQAPTSRRNDDSKFGVVSPDERPGEERDYTLPRETIHRGPDLSRYWRNIVGVADWVRSHGYEYRLRDQNSNTFVAEALRYSGLPTRKRNEVPRVKAIADNGEEQFPLGFEDQFGDPIDPTGKGRFDPQLRKGSLPTQVIPMVPPGLGPALVPQYKGGRTRSPRKSGRSLIHDFIGPARADAMPSETIEEARLSSAGRQGGSALHRREREILAMMRDDRESYFRDEGVQKEFRNIRARLDRMNARRPRKAQPTRVAGSGNIRFYG